MADEDTSTKKSKKGGGGSGGSPLYGLGMIGAWVYFFQKASEPEEYVVAFLKGLVWPAFMVYEGFAAIDRWRDKR